MYKLNLKPNTYGLITHGFIIKRLNIESSIYEEHLKPSTYGLITHGIIIKRLSIKSLLYQEIYNRTIMY